MNNSKRLNLAQTATIRTAIQSMLNRACIVSYGIVKDKPANGIVTVELSVANSEKGIKVITCVLMSLASSTFTIDIVPEIGDKVLVLYPDKFDPDMFDVEKTETIINDTATGYNLFGGVAILMNQYRKNQHKNFIQCKDGELSVHLAYDKNSSKNKAVFDLKKTGVLEYSVGTNKITADLSDTQNGKITISDSNNCTFETTSVSTKINGHLEIKK